MAAPGAGHGALVPVSQASLAKDDKKSSSRTVTDTIIGEHEHTIVGYSLVKGIGDGEPIASERFTVGGHEWVLLFYPDGESDAPQGVVNTTDGRVDPNARNCHGYRKFVKRSVLENLNSGYLVADTIIIKYTIELVVSSGGALARAPGASLPKLPTIQVPPPTLGRDLATLLEAGEAADVTFQVEGEELPAHRIVLTARSPVFHALLNSGMREGAEGVVKLEDVRAPVFRTLLQFVYTDALPQDLEGAALEVAMAQHLLVAADRFQLGRLRRICERRLCETVEVETAATTLALAEQNHASELKRVCLDFVSRNLQAVMTTDGYQHMVQSCPQLQAELLRVIAIATQERSYHHGHRTRQIARAVHPPGERPRTEDGRDEAGGDDDARRVRQRRE
ncbi:hypothetical protein WJX81_005251 [Elliptochloris bilobata]|uniref:BTB domain-containing protein n=1 Tax=Elliptochloris bilobata TaxID=381761 RepID=A0AAW1QY02_9CHLO